MTINDETINRVTETVRERMGSQQAGHGFDHVLRVHRNACQIQSESGGNRKIIRLAALLHDIGDAKFNDGIEKSASLSREILGALGIEPEAIEHIAHIVDNISFRKTEQADPLSLEGQIVQDADRLDALGAIGIVRTIEYGAAFGQPFHLSNNLNGQEKTGLQHFDDKLFKLVDLLNTDSARRMAKQREAFMRDFVAQFLSEWSDDVC